jgi:hypothetical protein
MYARQKREGVQAVICHPELVGTGLDLLDFPTIIFCEQVRYFSSPHVWCSRFQNFVSNHKGG